MKDAMLLKLFANGTHQWSWFISSVQCSISMIIVSKLEETFYLGEPIVGNPLGDVRYIVVIEVLVHIFSWDPVLTSQERNPN